MQGEVGINNLVQFFQNVIRNIIPCLLLERGDAQLRCSPTSRGQNLPPKVKNALLESEPKQGVQNLSLQKPKGAGYESPAANRGKTNPSRPPYSERNSPQSWMQSPNHYPPPGSRDARHKTDSKPETCRRTTGVNPRPAWGCPAKPSISSPHRIPARPGRRP